MTRSLARELGTDNVTVNAVSPGYTLSEGNLANPDFLAAHRQAAIAGRDPRKLYTYNLCTVIVDETDAKAQAKFDEYRQYASYDGALVFMSG